MVEPLGLPFGVGQKQIAEEAPRVASAEGDGADAGGGTDSSNSLMEPRRGFVSVVGMEVTNLAQRILKFFQNPHAVIPWTDDARLTFTGFQMVFDAQCAIARVQGHEAVAAPLGVAPWHTVMISAALMELEIAAEENGVCDPDGTAWIENHHFVRACDLVHVFHAMRDVWE